MTQTESQYRSVVRRASLRHMSGGVRPLPPSAVKELCDQLLGRSPSHLSLYIRSSRRHARIEVVLALVRRTFDLRHHDAAEALRVAKVALRLARRLAPPPPLRTLAADALAESLGNLGDLFRAREQHRRADVLLDLAGSAAERGSKDPCLRGRLAEWRSSLRRDQGRFPEALSELRAARASYLGIKDRQSLGRVHLLSGICCSRADEPRQAIHSLRKARRFLDARSNPLLGLIVVHNFILSLEAAGQHRFAWLAMEHASSLYREIALPRFLARGLGLRGRLLGHVGELCEAARVLDDSRRLLLERGLHYDAAMVALDLALVLAKQNKPLALAELAREMHEVFTSKQIPSEAAKALAHFERAAASWQVDVAFMDRLLGELAPIRRSTGR